MIYVEDKCYLVFLDLNQQKMERWQVFKEKDHREGGLFAKTLTKKHSNMLTCDWTVFMTYPGIQFGEEEKGWIPDTGCGIPDSQIANRN